MLKHRMVSIVCVLHEPIIKQSRRVIFQRKDDSCDRTLVIYTLYYFSLGYTTPSQNKEYYSPGIIVKQAVQLPQKWLTPLHQLSRSYIAA